MPDTLSYEEHLATRLQDPAFRARWERSALGRAVSLWLVAYRAQHGLSIEDLAARAHLPVDELLDLEAEDVEPTVDVLLRLSRGLDTPLHLRLQRGAADEGCELVTVDATHAIAA
jgi:transcriptional regulator with XRE-family HTH domain